MAPDGPKSFRIKGRATPPGQFNCAPVTLFIISTLAMPSPPAGTTKRKVKAQPSPVIAKFLVDGLLNVIAPALEREYGHLSVSEM